MSRFDIDRRRALAALAAGVCAPAFAQDKYPARPVRIVVPWAVGTPPDVAARVIAGKLPEVLRQPVVVENRPGASGTIGIAEVVRAPADGYTVGALHYATATVASLFPAFKVDLTRDVTGVGQIEWGHNILVVSPQLGVNTVAELVAKLKAAPAQYASSGVGTPAHLSGLMFLRATGTEAVHLPYNNFGQAISDVSTGRVTFMVLAAPAAVPQVQGGRLKALASTGPVRNPNLRDVPTVAELKLPSMESRTWSGLVVRSGTPADIVERLSSDIAQVMRMSEVQEQLLRQQSEVPSESVGQFRDQIRKDVEFGVSFVRSNGIRLD